MRILVAGGRGFIGRATARALAEAGHAVVIGEVDDLDARAAEGADVLVWAAGQRNTTEAEGHAMHVAGPVAAWRACGARRLVYLSSGEVYGGHAPPPFAESLAPRGTSPYARAKLAGEAAVRQTASELGASAVILRLAVVYGPGQQGAMFVPALVGALAAGRPFPMSPGAQTRDFVHVADVARLIAASVAAGAPAGTYNGATGRETTVAQVADWVVAAFVAHGRPEAAELVWRGAQAYRPDEQMRYALDPGRAATDLGWRATIAPEAGLAGVVADALGAGAR